MVFTTTIPKKLKSGTAVVPAGQTSVVVSNSMPGTDYAVVLTPEANVVCWVTNKTISGFTINISAPQAVNLNVHWIVRKN